MFSSIFEDFKSVFRSGNMLSKIIIVNIVVFVIINILFVFDSNSGNPSSFANVFLRKLSIVSDPIELLKQFWSILTHMFLHKGVSHIFWNMILLYWFGRIVGDLLNDRRVLPLYLLGGLAGGLSYFVFYQFVGGNSYALGASAAVNCMLMVAAATAPDYELNLLLIGRVRLKYVVITLLFLDLIFTASANTGGYVAHLGGAVFGWTYVMFLRKGTDLTETLQNLIDKISTIGQPRIKKTPRSTFTVYKSDKSSDKKEKFSQQDELDRILEKIKQKGMDKLTAEEKEFLYQASKKK